MSSISLDNAWLLLIAVPLVILLAVPFVIAVRKDNRNGHNIASCVLHIVIAVLVAFAAAGVTMETTLTETDVFVVADVSYSANRNLTKIDGYIEDLQDNLPNNSKMGVIVFGKDYEVNTRMGESFSTVKNYGVDDSQTDIASALEYAGNIFSTGVIKRIVLITDSMQTGENGDDELKQVVDDLLARGIYIDAIYLDDNITDDVAEVQITDVSCSQTTYTGQTAQAAVTVRSTQAVSATVSIYLDNNGTEEIVSYQSLKLNAGTTNVTFDLSDEREAGTYSYVARIETNDSADDANPYNNTCYFTQEVQSSVNILLITGVQADATNAQSAISGMDITMDVYCSENEIPAVPYTIAEICSYDIIMLADIDLSTLNNYSMLIDSIGTAVSQLGKSLIGVGNLYLQNTEDEALLKLQNMLPVTYGDSSRGNKFYTIIIDCSYSMFGESRLARAKEAAKAVVNLLSADDELCIIQTYSDSEIIYNNAVGDGSAAIEIIENIEPKQGTVLNGGLNMAYNTMSGLTSFSGRSVILITDGATDDDDDCNQTVQNLYSKGITTSVISVDSSSATNSENASFLYTLAEGYGHGEYFNYTSTSNNLSSIIDTVQEGLEETIVDDTTSAVSANYKNYNDSVLDGVKSGGFISSSSDYLSYIKGYMVTSSKTGATTVLTTTHTNAGSTASSTVPVYSYWSYGSGSTAAFTSSLSGSWVANWQSRNILQTLFADIVNTNIPAERVDTPYTVSVNKDTDSFTVEVTPVEVKTGATVTVTVTSPDGTVNTLTNVVFDSSAAAYTSSFNFDATGTYKITVGYEYNGTVYNSYNYYAGVSYLAEYDSFLTYDAALLYQLIGADGTVSEDGSLTIVNDESEITKRTVDLTVPILILAAVLFVADIVIRKLKWSDIVSLFKKVDGGRKA